MTHCFHCDCDVSCPVCDDIISSLDEIKNSKCPICLTKRHCSICYTQEKERTIIGKKIEVNDRIASITQIFGNEAFILFHDTWEEEEISIPEEVIERMVSIFEANSEIFIIERNLSSVFDKYFL